MWYEIPAHVVLANVLLHGKNSVRIGELKILRNKIEKEIPSVRLDITSSSIGLATEYYSNLFTREGENISLCKGSKSLFTEEFVNERFNKCIPVDVRGRVIQSFREAMCSEPVGV